MDFETDQVGRKAVALADVDEGQTIKAEAIKHSRGRARKNKIRK